MQTASLAVVLSSCALSTSALAVDQVFRGLDIHPTGSNTVMSPFTNSTNAQTAFMGALSSPSVTQNFESLVNGSLPATLNFGPVNAGLTSQASVTTRVEFAQSAVNTYPTDGSQYLYSESVGLRSFFTLQFDSPVQAFGFFLIDPSDFFGVTNAPGPLFIELLGPGNVVQGTFDHITAAPPTGIRNGSVAYFGVIADTPFTGVRIAQPGTAAGGPGEGDGVGFDQMTIAIPTPSAALALGAAGALAVRRRRR